MTWMEVQIATTLEAEEAVINLFYDIGAKGVVIESGENLLVVESDPTVNYIDDSILNMDPETSYVRGYFPKNDEFDEAMHQLITGIKKLPSYGLNPGGCELSITEMEEEDWANSWKKYYRPTKIGKAIVVKPTWESYKPAEDEIIVNMDPGMAFGTGTHETTQLCVMALEKYMKKDDRVYDIGCGSGILSIVAAELGARKVTGVDFDPVAVDAAVANVKLNNMSKKIKIAKGNLLDVIPKGQEADLIISNILAEAIIELTASIRPYLKDNGYFISSGIIHERLGAVVTQLKANHFEVIKIETMGEWNAVAARKTPRTCIDSL